MVLMDQLLGATPFLLPEGVPDEEDERVGNLRARWDSSGARGPARHVTMRRRKHGLQGRRRSKGRGVIPAVDLCTIRKSARSVRGCREGGKEPNKYIPTQLLVWLLAVLMVWPWPLRSAAQSTGTTFKPEEIEQFVAPIALYPDSLVSQILMASTYPLEMVQADRWAKANKSLKGEARPGPWRRKPGTRV